MPDQLESQKMVKKLNNRFAYWCAGVLGFIFHPIKVPIAVAKLTETVEEYAPLEGEEKK